MPKQKRKWPIKLPTAEELAIHEARRAAPTASDHKRASVLAPRSEHMTTSRALAISRSVPHNVDAFEMFEAMRVLLYDVGIMEKVVHVHLDAVERLRGHLNDAMRFGQLVNKEVSKS